jgi:hypothetical protein
MIMLKFLDWLSVPQVSRTVLHGVAYTEIYWLYGMQTAELVAVKLRT